MDRRTFLGGAIAGSAAAAAARAANNNGEIQAAQYVIVELMGHKRLAGRMVQGPSGLLQLDVPAPGGFVTKFINPSSIYCITVVDEKTVVAAAKTVDPLPALMLDVPERQTYLGFDDRDDDESF